MKRAATFTLTSSYQKLSDLASAFTGTPLSGLKKFHDGAFRAASATTSSVRISIIPSGGAASDDASVLLAAGEYLAFNDIDISKVWAKGDGGVATLELEGDD